MVPPRAYIYSVLCLKWTLSYSHLALLLLFFVIIYTQTNSAWKFFIFSGFFFFAFAACVSLHFPLAFSAWVPRWKRDATARPRFVKLNFTPFLQLAGLCCKNIQSTLHRQTHACTHSHAPRWKRGHVNRPANCPVIISLSWQVCRFWFWATISISHLPAWLATFPEGSTHLKLRSDISCSSLSISFSVLRRSPWKVSSSTLCRCVLDISM